MDFMKVISEDEEIQELKRIIKNNGGHVPGFGFWDGEMIEEYRIRLQTITKRRNHRGVKRNRFK